MENCGIGGSPMGTKTAKQCLETVTVLYILAKEDQKFASAESFKTRADWDTAIEAGEIAPLWEIYEFANANTDATFYESRNFKKQTTKATKMYEAEVYLGLCGHKLLKSYDSSEFTRLYEVTEDGAIIGVKQSDGTIKGQSLKEFTVGIRNNATTDKVPNTKISITFTDYEELEDNPMVVIPNFNPVIDLEGIEQVEVSILEAPVPSATGFSAEVLSVCGGSIDIDFKTEDFLILNGDGTEVTPTSIERTAKTDIYVIVAVGLSGVISFGLNGTVTDNNADMYQSNTDTYTIV